MTPVFTGRVEYGPDTFRGVVMNTHLANNHYAELGAKLGKEIGDKIANKLSALKAAKPERVTYRGGVPMVANLTLDETEEYIPVIPHVGEYANDVENLAAAGLSLTDFVKSRLNDEKGIPFRGSPPNMSATLRSAVDKQSELFAAKFPPKLTWSA
jgi:hypothetical protein